MQINMKVDFAVRWQNRLKVGLGMLHYTSRVFQIYLFVIHSFRQCWYRCIFMSNKLIPPEEDRGPTWIRMLYSIDP
jgi:hypothetical protein